MVGDRRPLRPGGRRLRVLHVLPSDLARGAQVFARALADQLDGPGAAHTVMTLFTTPPAVLRPDHRLDVTPGRMRAAGYDARVPVRLARRLRRLRPDIVVTHGGEALLYVAPVLPPATALVHKRIGITSEAALTPARRLLHGLALRRVRAVAAVSAETVAETRRLFGLPEDRVHLLPNGRDPDVYRPGPARPGGAVPRLCFVGELEEVKRPANFVAVVAAIRSSGLPVEAWMVGDGPLAASVRPAAASAGVDLLGRRDDVPALLASADVVCLTSRTEGMPGVLIEAGLSGLAAVSTDVSGAGSVIDDGVTGFVVPVDDVDAFIASTRRLVLDADLRARMGAAARARCVERFSIEVSARRWADLLATVADGPGVCSLTVRPAGRRA